MSEPGSRTPPAIWHASADAIVATVAAGMVLLVFYPVTLFAAGVKRLVRTFRSDAVSHSEEHRAITE
jgi:hypothetical protein